MTKEELESSIRRFRDLKIILDGLRDIFEKDNALLISEVSELESKIKEEVIRTGKSVSENGVELYYNRGRITWDSKALERYSIEYPEIVKARKVGKPYVTLRIEEK